MKYYSWTYRENMKETLYENTRNWWSNWNQPTFYLTIIAYMKNEPKNNNDGFVEV